MSSPRLNVILSLLATVAFVSPLLSQPKPADEPGAQGNRDRCAALRELIAKHPAANPAAEDRRRQRLADCLAGKSGSEEGDAPTAGTPPSQNDAGSDTQSAGTNSPATPAPASAAPATAAANPAVSPRMGVAPPTALTKLVQEYTQLQFVITTADDDLRTNSTAWVTLQSSDGSTQKCSLKTGGAPWEESSTHTIPCTLSRPMSADQLKAARLMLEYDGRPNADAQVMTVDPLQTFDNWKVSEVRISAHSDAQPQDECVADEKGDPLLVEMKNDNRTFDLSGRAGTGC